jgi:predicted transcriptional regulator/transcriptional regulator with XRE-family HTH domain
MKQAALAEAAGVSPSYLNLIEHNHRRIGGKLLLALARVLDVEPSHLTEGTDPGLADMLDLAARGKSARDHAGAATDGAVPAEMDRIDEFTARFPGWSAVIAAQEVRARALEGQIEALRDRLTHDTGLSEAMHEVLSSIAAIRSTADILVRETDLDAAWRGRFHRNLHEEAERLSGRATGLLAQFEAPGPGGLEEAAPTETVEALFEASGHHFAEIEAQGEAGIEAVLARGAGLDDPGARALAVRKLSAYARDAARLPMAVFGPAALAAGFDPAALLGLARGDVALVLRRMASIPTNLGPPDFGLAICDASGAVLHRRRLVGFPIQRGPAGCPLWPLYRVLGRPGQAEVAVLDMPRGVRFRAWTVAQDHGRAGFGPGLGSVPVMQATMLVTPLPAGSTGADIDPDIDVIPAGPGCETCPRQACPARR